MSVCPSQVPSFGTAFPDGERCIEDDFNLADIGGLEFSFSENRFVGGCTDVDVLYDTYLAGFDQSTALQSYANGDNEAGLDSILFSLLSKNQEWEPQDWQKTGDSDATGIDNAARSEYYQDRTRHRKKCEVTKRQSQEIRQDSVQETYSLYEAPSPSSSSSSSSSSSLALDNWDLTQEEFLDLDRYIPPNEKWVDSAFDLLGAVDPFTKSTAEGRVCSPAEEEEEKLDEIVEVEEPLIYQEVYGNRGYIWRQGPKIKASNAVSQKVKTSSRKGERGPKIWEFLMRLLVDPMTNPELIRWDDVTNGTFVLTQPGVIAQLWGTRANKPNLSANNFARALRYHYSTGALTAVSERHYMYKCGPKAFLYLSAIEDDTSKGTQKSC